MENESKIYKGPVRGQVDSGIRVWLSLKGIGVCFLLTAREVVWSIQVYPRSDTSQSWIIDFLEGESKFTSPQGLHSNDPNREDLLTRARTISW